MNEAGAKYFHVYFEIYAAHMSKHRQRLFHPPYMLQAASSLPRNCRFLFLADLFFYNETETRFTVKL